MQTGKFVSDCVEDQTEQVSEDTGEHKHRTLMNYDLISSVEKNIFFKATSLFHICKLDRVAHSERF